MCSFYCTVIHVLLAVVISAVFDTVCVKAGVCFCVCVCNVYLYILAWCLYRGTFWVVVNLGINCDSSKQWLGF